MKRTVFGGKELSRLSNLWKMTFWFPSFSESLEISSDMDSVGLSLNSLLCVSSAGLEDRAPITMAGQSSICDQGALRRMRKLDLFEALGERPWLSQHSAGVWGLNCLQCLVTLYPLYCLWVCKDEQDPVILSFTSE
jgi:hypothetical protein